MAIVSRSINRGMCALGALLIGSCARSGTVVVSSVPASTPSASGSPAAPGTPRRGTGWRIETREHLDLWLHGFAMLQDDQSLVPYFRLGYRAAMSQARNASPAWLLEVNRDRLQRRVAENPALVSAQFLALYFASWDDLRRGSERFVRDNGMSRYGDRDEMLRMYQTLRTYFPAAADRDFLRLLVASLDDERQRFYGAWWLQQQQLRAGTRSQIEALWTGRYRAAFARLMNNTMQRDGAILLSLTLGGEGRTLAVGPRDNFVGVTFPAPTDDPREALFVTAHEVVGSVATAAVRDNASAAEERAGDAARWSALAAVRGGAMLLERVAPDLLDDYQKYYLQLARARLTGDRSAQFAQTFPLPDTIRDALARQIDAVLSGI